MTNSDKGEALLSLYSTSRTYTDLRKRKQVEARAVRTRTRRSASVIVASTTGRKREDCNERNKCGDSEKTKVHGEHEEESSPFPCENEAITSRDLILPVSRLYTYTLAAFYDHVDRPSAIFLGSVQCKQRFLQDCVEERRGRELFCFLEARRTNAEN